MQAKACVKTGETLVVALETREREGEVAFISSHQQTRYPEDRVSSPQMMETENDLTPPRSLEESQTWAKDSVRDLPAVGPISSPEGLGSRVTGTKPGFCLLCPCCLWKHYSKTYLFKRGLWVSE